MRPPLSAIEPSRFAVWIFTRGEAASAASRVIGCAAIAVAWLPGAVGAFDGWLGTIGVVFKLWSADTGGAVSVVEHPFPVGALVPPHLHTREDEFSIVTEGEIGFRSGDREAVLGAGGYITKPRGELHTMWNAGTTPARMIEIISPGGFEGFFRDGVALTSQGKRRQE